MECSQISTAKITPQRKPNGHRPPGDPQIQCIMNLMAFFTETEKSTPMITLNYKGSPQYKIVLRKKNKSGVITIASFQLCHKVMVIKTLWYWHKHRTVKKKGIEEPRNKCPHT